MRCASAARRTALTDLPSPECSLKLSGSFHVTAPPLLVKPRPGEKELSSPSSVCSRHSSPGISRQHRLKISVQRDAARLVVPAPAIIEGLADRLILIVGIGRRLAAWRVRPEAQGLRYPPDPLGLVDETDDVQLSAALGTDQRMDFPDRLDRSAPGRRRNIVRLLLVQSQSDHPPVLMNRSLPSAAMHGCYAAGRNFTRSNAPVELTSPECAGWLWVKEGYFPYFSLFTILRQERPNQQPRLGRSYKLFYCLFLLHLRMIRPTQVAITPSPQPEFLSRQTGDLVTDGQ